MKFVTLTAFVAAVVATEGETCDDATVTDVCTEEGACCGWKTDAADVTRVCSGAAEASPSDIEEPVTFSCVDPAAASEEKSSKLFMAAAAVLSAIYFA